MRVRIPPKALKNAKTKMGLVISLVKSNIRLSIEIALVAALLVAGWLYRKQERELDETRIQYGKLAANLQGQIIIKDGQITVLKRKGGKVETRYAYFPPEGYFTLKYPTPTASNPNPEPIVESKVMGFCFRPGIGLELGGMGLQGHLDAKLAYYNRYSLIFGGSRYNLGLGVSRHVDDWMFFKPQNIELFCAYNLLRANGLPPITIGFRSNF